MSCGVCGKLLEQVSLRGPVGLIPEVVMGDDDWPLRLERGLVRQGQPAIVDGRRGRVLEDRTADCRCRRRRKKRRCAFQESATPVGDTLRVRHLRNAPTI